MTEQNKIKIIIPPQVLAQMEQDMSPEEVQRLMTQLEAAVESGTIFEDSVPMDLAEMALEDPEDHAEIIAAMTRDGFDNFDEWVEWTINQRPTLN